MFAAAVRHAPVLRWVRLGLVFALMLVIVDAAPADAIEPGVVVTRDVPYGTAQDEELKLDVYHPQAAALPSPIVILIHGGGWVRGDKDDYAPMSRALARTGYLVFDINYSLDPSAGPAYPRQVTDVHTALAWVQEHAEDFHGDIGRIAVAGGSAGGHLAAMLGTQADEQGPAPVRAVVSLSGPMDIGALVDSIRSAATPPSGPCQPLDCATLQEARERLRILVGCDPLECPDQLVRKASPITYVTSTSPPFFLANSTEETVPPMQAMSMATALQSRSVPVELHLVPGDRHGVAVLPAVRDPLLAFLATHLAADGSTAEKDLSTAEGTPPAQPQETQARGRLLRWVVPVAGLCLLVVMVAVRRRTSGTSASGRSHGSELQGRTHDREPQSDRSEERL